MIRGQKHRKSTKSTYHKVWQKFNNFLIQLDKIPQDWESRLALYVTHMYLEKMKSTTIRSYVCAVRSILADDGYELKESKMLFSALTRATRLCNDRVINRFPIQKGLLRLLLFEFDRILNEKAQQDYLTKMYQCMAIFGYYGLLRIGEMATGQHPILACNVHKDNMKQKILLILFTSKTHGLESRPQKIKIWSDTENKDVFSPFQVTQDYLEVRGDYYHDLEQFFIFRDGTPVKPCQFRRLLRKAIKNLGLNPKFYDTHSLRIGRASDLLKIGYSIDQIKQLGRWKSNAVFKYLRN